MFIDLPIPLPELLFLQPAKLALLTYVTVSFTLYLADLQPGLDSSERAGFSLDECYHGC